VRPDSDVHHVFRLAEQGLSQAAIARHTGIARATVRDWLRHGEATVLRRPMRIRGTQRKQQRTGCVDVCKLIPSIDEPSYAYLLGQYLGDGCISEFDWGTRLRLSCCDGYPNIMAECADAVRSVTGGARVGYVAKQGCTEVYATWPHWTCLFPQHGPGLKHRRSIVLVQWQREIAIERWPDQLVRGLIHSDGCRAINKVTVKGKRYEYVRYFFKNESQDIRNIFIAVCERLGVSARYNRHNSVSVARRDSVAILERIIGPKS
jgi:hypothetical protein